MVLIAWNKDERLLCNALHYKYKATLEQEKSGNEGKQMSEGEKKSCGSGGRKKEQVSLFYCRMYLPVYLEVVLFCSTFVFSPRNALLREENKYETCICSLLLKVVCR